MVQRLRYLWGHLQMLEMEVLLLPLPAQSSALLPHTWPYPAHTTSARLHQSHKYFQCHKLEQREIIRRFYITIFFTLWTYFTEQHLGVVRIVLNRQGPDYYVHQLGLVL